LARARPIARIPGLIYPKRGAMVQPVRAHRWPDEIGTARRQNEDSMGSGFQFLDILFFAAIAVFLVFKLRSVLGKRIGHEQKPSRGLEDVFLRRGRTANDAGRGPDKVIPLPDRRGEAEPAARDAGAATPLDAGIARIRAVDPGFTADSFTAGARGAFEMIVAAYAAGDLGVLKPLLNTEVFERFRAAIEQRRKAGEKLETTLVGIKSAELMEAELADKLATVSVKFVSEQVNVTRDATGKAVEGDPAHVATVTDIWTFQRNVRSRDPNWALIATQSPS
jgi:predicted lipid-binding transport protein (Tim44 family)